MRTLVLLTAIFAAAYRVSAQSTDPLEVTLPNGKVVHFQTAEQKAKFEAAQARLQNQGSGSQQPSASPTATPVNKITLGSSLDAPSSNPKVAIRGKILRMDVKGELTIFAEHTARVGVNQADGYLGLKGVPNLDKLSEGDLVDVIGTEDGFQHFGNDPDEKIRAYRFVSGRFTNSSGTTIK